MKGIDQQTARHDWRTPPAIIDALREMSGADIALDPCASVDQSNWFAMENITVNDTPNGLQADWNNRGGLVFVNPPYQRAEIVDWTQKIKRESKRCAIAALVPASVGARWFDALWLADSLCFIRGRIKFLLPTSEEVTSAPFWSALALWDRDPGASYARHFDAHMAKLGKVVSL